MRHSTLRECAASRPGSFGLRRNWRDRNFSSESDVTFLPPVGAQTVSTCFWSMLWAIRKSENRTEALALRLPCQYRALAVDLCLHQDPLFPNGPTDNPGSTPWQLSSRLRASRGVAANCFSGLSSGHWARCPNSQCLSVLPLLAECRLSQWHSPTHLCNGKTTTIISPEFVCKYMGRICFIEPCDEGARHAGRRRDSKSATSTHSWPCRASGCVQYAGHAVQPDTDVDGASHGDEARLWGIVCHHDRSHPRELPPPGERQGCDDSLPQ